MIKAALFDYGGTLVTSVGNDILPLVVEGAKHAHIYLQKVKPDAPNFNTFYQAASNALQSAYMAIMGSPGELKAGEVMDEILNDLDIFLSKEQFDGIHARVVQAVPPEDRPPRRRERGLQALKDKGMKLGVVSNTIWPQYIIDEEMKRLGLDGYFDCVITSCAFGTEEALPGDFRAHAFETRRRCVGGGVRGRFAKGGRGGRVNGRNEDDTARLEARGSPRNHGERENQRIVRTGRRNREIVSDGSDPIYGAHPPYGGQLVE